MTNCVKKYTSKEDICVAKLQVHMSKTNKLDISEVNPVKEEKSRPGDYVRDSDQNVNSAKGESIPSVHHTKQRTESKSNANIVEKSDSKLKKWKKRMRFQPKNVTAMQDPPHEYFKKLMSSNAVTDVELPRVVSVMEHASAAANEIKAMMSAIKQHSGNKTALQV
uniref:Uncharacterized protein n=1 Tax=Ciona savignyi TaxID=51511 RepID=H2YH83_CIOSA